MGLQGVLKGKLTLVSREQKQRINDLSMYSAPEDTDRAILSLHLLHHSREETLLYVLSKHREASRRNRIDANKQVLLHSFHKAT